MTAQELRAAGLTPKAVAVRRQAGRLHPLHPGVDAVGHLALGPDALALAAVLACGPGAVLSHLSAAVLWELLRAIAGPVHVLRTGTHRRGPAGVRLHRAVELRPADVRVLRGVPVTSPARTLLDLAATIDDDGLLARALDEARARRLVGRKELARMIGTGRPGTASLRRALLDGPTFTRSEAERRLLTVVRAAGLERPRTNVRIAGFEVDALWPGARLVVEVDGYVFHSGRRAFEHDRLRDQRLQATGYRVLRFTWRQLTERPEAVAATLGAALARDRR